jgi:hypothetical protein
MPRAVEIMEQPSTNSESTVRFLQTAQSFGGAIAIVLGILYVFGLLIVNVNLSQYGLTSSNLARAEYALAGALWIGLCGIMAAGLELIVRTIRKGWQPGQRLKAMGLAALQVMTVLFTIFYALLILSHSQLEFDWKSLWMVGVLAWNGVCVGAAAENLRTAAKQGFSIGAFFEDKTQRLGAANRIVILLYVLAALVGYGKWVYPEIPQEFGGGRKPEVTIHFKEHQEQKFYAGLGLPASADGASIGPVNLILETDSFLMVTGATGEGDPKPAVGIDKSLISVIVYKAKHKKIVEPAQKPASASHPSKSPPSK